MMGRHRGFDRNRDRVLSEWYTRNATSICSRPGSLFSALRTGSIKNGSFQKPESKSEPTDIVVSESRNEDNWQGNRRYRYSVSMDSKFKGWQFLRHPGYIESTGNDRFEYGAVTVEDNDNSQPGFDEQIETFSAVSDSISSGSYCTCPCLSSDDNLEGNIKEKKHEIFGDCSCGEVHHIDKVPNLSTGSQIKSKEVSSSEHILNSVENNEEADSVSSSSIMSVEASNSSDLSSIKAQSEDSCEREGERSNQSTHSSLEGLSSLIDDFDPEENCSKGSLMAVSGSEACLGSPFHDLEHLFGGEESRNFSYMSDVFDEAGYCWMKPFIDLNKWYSLESPISPLVFDCLEEKYGKQEHWQKSERQLLFSLINSGLLVIFSPLLNLPACEPATRSWIRASFRREEIEDEVWGMVMRLWRKEVVAEKGLEGWVELEEGMSLVYKEVEAFLFDELVAEFAGDLLDS